MKAIFTAFLLFVCLHVSAQHTLRIAEWNVENLFDTQADSIHDDREFLPDGTHHWTRSRYSRKLDEVARAILAMGDTIGLPAVVGLCEVENDTVLTHLTQRSILRNAGYRYIMTDSPDRRGIDVALLYHPALFRLLHHHAVRVPSKAHHLSPTRDLLYASGLTPSGDTLHVILCHLPSKTGGVKNANRHRRLAAQTIRHTTDSIIRLSPHARLIVMGDFNATSRESIFRKLIPPLRETLPTTRRELNRPIGTYYFQGLWSYLDHILVSPAVRHNEQAHEVRLPFLLDNEGHPYRTFRGPTYIGGISDHLPLILDIQD